MPRTRSCPDCAGEILARARYCKHCGWRSSSGVRPAIRGLRPRGSSSSSSKVVLWVLLGVAVVGVAIAWVALRPRSAVSEAVRDTLGIRPDARSLVVDALRSHGSSTITYTQAHKIAREVAERCVSYETRRLSDEEGVQTTLFERGVLLDQTTQLVLVMVLEESKTMGIRYELTAQ